MTSNLKEKKLIVFVKLFEHSNRDVRFNGDSIVFNRLFTIIQKIRSELFAKIQLIELNQTQNERRKNDWNQIFGSQKSKIQNQ